MSIVLKLPLTRHPGLAQSLTLASCVLLLYLKVFSLSLVAADWLENIFQHGWQLEPNS